MGYYIPRQKIRELKNPKFRNYFWENWAYEGYIPGILLMFLGIALSIIEIVRIVYGITHRGIRKKESLIFFRYTSNSIKKNLFFEQTIMTVLGILILQFFMKAFYGKWTQTIFQSELRSFIIGRGLIRQICLV